MKQQIRAISLVGFKTYSEIEKYIKAFPQAKFELSYCMSSAFLKEVTPLIKDRVVSLHALCPSEEYFPNLASHDNQVVKNSIELLKRSCVTAKKYGATLIVLHPGYLTDKAMPSDGVLRVALLNSKELLPFIGFEKGSICKKDYTSRELYINYFETMVNNLLIINKIVSSYGLKLAIENLNPRAGYLFIEPDEMIKLANTTPLTFCLDVGHLWISSKVFGFDFLSSIEKLLNTGRIISMHLHSNPSTENYFIDSHSNLCESNFPYKEVIALAKRYKDINLVLETVQDFLKNSKNLENLLLL